MDPTDEVAKLGERKKQGMNRRNRQTFQEMTEMILLPGEDGRKFISRRPAWLPGQDFSHLLDVGAGKALPNVPKAVYGAHVYVGSVLAACKVMRKEMEKKKRVMTKAKPGSKNDGKALQGLHTIHGTFTMAGLVDRPFVYSVSPLSLTRSFSTALVTAAQPTVPGIKESCEDTFILPADPHECKLPTMRESCFQALVSFKTPEPTQRHEQEPSVQSRFASILSSRSPSDWPPSPVIDVDGVLETLPPELLWVVGSFPAVEMRKVDMGSHNEGKPLHERRELILYRLLAPLPEDSLPEEHALVHAYECDKNGLLMLANQIGFGRSLGGVATLAWTYVIHGNLEESRIEFGENEWWIQEVFFPRAGAGRGIVMSKMWNPKGVHVATEYQDGVVRKWNKDGKL